MGVQRERGCREFIVGAVYWPVGHYCVKFSVPQWRQGQLPRAGRVGTSQPFWEVGVSFERKDKKGELWAWEQ
jgi:hypothetical protein